MKREDVWTIRQVAAFTGLSSRTLRHYHEIGLLEPVSTGPGGLRHYDRAGLIRLQRILLWRGLGVALPRIGEILDGEVDDVAALTHQQEQLRRRLVRITDQLAAVEATIAALEKGEEIMPEEMFDGFDHRKYEAEVRERWGEEAAAESNRWWNELGERGREEFRVATEDLNMAWDEVIASGADPTDGAAQEVAGRHLEWLRRSWPGAQIPRKAIAGIARMYVDDPRFAKNYTRVSATGARFVRDAILHRIAE